MNVTIKHIADRVGVSKQAVSYALNNTPGQVSEATREKILEAAKQMGYRPNWRARSFARQRSQIIGLVYGRPAEYMENSKLVSALVHRLAEIDHELLLIPAAGPVEKWAHKLSDGRVDGCLIGHPMPLGLDRFVSEHRVPAIFANLQTDLPVPQIRFDDTQGTRLALRHLIDLGHQRIAYFCTPKSHGEHYSNLDRLESYQQEMTHAELADCIDVSTELHTQDYVFGLLSRPVHERPTAILAYNDLDAVLLMQLLWRNGIRIPHDLSLIGFNDDPSSRESTPPLTTVATPIHELVNQAVDWLIKSIEGDTETQPQPIILPEQLIVRESTSAPRDA